MERAVIVSNANNQYSPLVIPLSMCRVGRGEGGGGRGKGEGGGGWDTFI